MARLQDAWGVSAVSALPAALAIAALVVLGALFLLQKKISGAALRGSAQATRRGVPPPLVPPVVRGLPLLGSALDLGSGGAAFLQRCRKQHGDAFTLRLLGQRMTFLYAPATLQHYFNAPDSELTFAPAVQQFTHRVFGLPPQHFYNRHIVMLQTLRHALVPASLPPHAAAALRLLLARLREWPPAGQLELAGALKGLVFAASVGSLFGDRFLQRCLGQQSDCPGSSGARQHPCRNGGAGSGAAAASAAAALSPLATAFFEFEEGFELSASPVPHIFQPRFLQARWRLLAALRAGQQAGEFEGTVVGQLIQACGLPDRYVPNMLLAVLWASLANAVPTSFWALGFLLLPENKRHLDAVRREAQDAVAAAAASAAEGESVNGGRQAGPLEEDSAGGLLSAAQQRGLLALAAIRRSHSAAAVEEALRLRSFSIDVRIAAADCVLPCGESQHTPGPGVLVRKGDVVAISPYASHQDPRLYPQAPEAYNPDREGMRLGGSAAMHSAVVGVGGVPGFSFGGARYRCPGRHFAEAELSLLLSLLVLLYDWQLLPREQSSGGGGGTGSGKAARAGSGGREGGSRQAGGAPGDPGGLLPPPDLRKLVGIKVPLWPCWVQATRRSAPH